jgi:hypothetical protein
MSDSVLVKSYDDGTSKIAIYRALPDNIVKRPGDLYLQVVRYLENKLASDHATAKFIFKISDNTRVRYDGKDHCINITCHGENSDINKLKTAVDDLCSSRNPIETQRIHVTRVETPVAKKTLRAMVKERRRYSALLTTVVIDDAY